MRIELKGWKAICSLTRPKVRAIKYQTGKNNEKDSQNGLKEFKETIEIIVQHNPDRSLVLGCFLVEKRTPAGQSCYHSSISAPDHF